MGLIVVGIFFLALVFCLSSYMGLDFSERLHLPETQKLKLLI